jgi:uncharacterized protein with HEPN domain
MPCVEEIKANLQSLKPELSAKFHVSAVDWHSIRGFRNRIAYHYLGIDHNILWQIKETLLQKRDNGKI